VAELFQSADQVVLWYLTQPVADWHSFPHQRGAHAAQVPQLANFQLRNNARLQQTRPQQLRDPGTVVLVGLASLSYVQSETDSTLVGAEDALAIPSRRLYSLTDYCGFRRMLTPSPYREDSIFMLGSGGIAAMAPTVPGFSYRWMIPRCIAAVAACVRSWAPSLLRMFFTWFFTVCSAMFSVYAICLFARPRTISSKT